MSDRTLVKMTFPGIARSASLARRWVADVLTAAGHQDVDGARLITSELFANAVLHTGSGRAGGLVTIEVFEIGHALARIEVIDEVPPLREPSNGDCGGRGLRLVHESSIRWGIRAMPPRRNSVWVEVSTLMVLGASEYSGWSDGAAASAREAPSANVHS
ncbi:ATP-binding protein [Nonomuraea sp. NPDC049269]|uniref:ATP-binding protein n=1 Tax=Nonomuraea sp. NPDC049269 TaxID=3364349 RepID=UPI00371AF77D